MMDLLRMKRLNLTPILINFRKIELLDNVPPTFQSDVDATDGKEKSTSNKSIKRTRLPINENSLSVERKKSGKVKDTSNKRLFMNKPLFCEFTNHFNRNRKCLLIYQILKY